VTADIIGLPHLSDLTAINLDATKKEIDYLIEVARTYSFASTFTPPFYTEYVRNKLEGSTVLTGAVAGFPSGAETTATKVFTAKDRIHAGAQEIDIVMNIGQFLDGEYGYVLDDIAAVKEVCGTDVPLKVIIETAFLNDVQIKQASGLVAKSGATFVKTSTGLWGKPTTPEMVALIKQTVGDSILIKAAGGIRSAETMSEMVELGANRFGLGCVSCVGILRSVDEAAGQPGRIDEILKKHGMLKNDNY